MYGNQYLSVRDQLGRFHCDILRHLLVQRHKPAKQDMSAELSQSSQRTARRILQDPTHALILAFDYTQKFEESRKNTISVL